MLKILSGNEIRDKRIPELKKIISDFSRPIVLSIIQIGNRLDSNSYIQAKKNFAGKIGIKIKHIQFDEMISEDEVLSYIEKENQDKQINGIILQLPLPKHINTNLVLNFIDPKKDIDGLTNVNQEKLYINDSSGILPATARGIIELLNYYEIEIKDRKVVVIGRSNLVGKPIAQLCKNRGAEVIVCHSQTIDLSIETKKADILIVAIGKAKFINSGHVKEGQIIIDIGISRFSDQTLSGDVDFEAVKDTVSAITPVPGGVGPMTVLSLFENLVEVVNNS